MPTASSLAWKTSLRKVRTLWHCSRLRSVALYLWLIVVISVRQSKRCSNIWASLPGAGYGQFEHKADSLIAKFKAGGTVREIDVWAITAIISLWLSASSSACRLQAVNHYRDNAITYKAQRDKNAKTWYVNAAITDMQMRRNNGETALNAALDAKCEGVKLMLKLKMMLCMMMLPLVVVSFAHQAVCQSVREATTASGVDNAASPTGRHRWAGLFHPSERGWSLCKNNWKEPREVY